MMKELIDFSKIKREDINEELIRKHYDIEKSKKVKSVYDQIAFNFSGSIEALTHTITTHFEEKKKNNPDIKFEMVSEFEYYLEEGDDEVYIGFRYEKTETDEEVIKRLIGSTKSSFAGYERKQKNLKSKKQGDEEKKIKEKENRKKLYEELKKEFEPEK